MYSLKFLALIKKFFQEFLPTYCKQHTGRLIDFLLLTFYNELIILRLQDHEDPFNNSIYLCTGWNQ